MDIDTISKDFIERLDEVLGHFEHGREEYRDLVQFMHFIICRHILQRKKLGLLDYTLDEKKRLLSARTVKEDTGPLQKEYLRDIDYSPFYYKLWAESDPVLIPSQEEIDGKPFEELGRLLNSNPVFIENAATDEGVRFVRVKNGRVYFERSKYADFQDWTNSFNALFTEAGNLAVFMVQNGYRYDLDRTKDTGKIIMHIYKHTESVYNQLLSGDSEVRNFPSEMKEVMSFIYMVTAARTFMASRGLDGPVS